MNLFRILFIGGRFIPFLLHLLCFAGDLGRVDENGFFYVCGRIKELIVTAGGRLLISNPIAACCLLKHIKYNTK